MVRSTVRKAVALLLAAAMGLVLLAGCQSAPPSPAPKPEPVTQEPQPEPADHSRDIPYTTAFVTPSAPEGYATPDTIAFYTEDEDGNATVQNVSPEEIAAFSAQRETLPRTDHFDSYLPENLLSLLPILDYSIYHGYSKICIPTSEFTGSEVIAADRYLWMIYHINGSGVAGRNVGSFENEAGETVNYVFVAIMGLKNAGAAHYREALEEAGRIVDSVPEGYGEYETALYLYRYLTDNVRYYYKGGTAYYDDTDWNLLYDALIKKSTVCAGYSEALYVLYNLAGIECFSIEGYIPMSDYNEKRYNGSHIWNVARINGVYYEFDPTWDEGYGVADYRFFAVSTEDLVYYYPRTIDAFTDEYCPPRTESIFPRMEPGDDSMDYQLLDAALATCNIFRSNPSLMLRLYGYKTDVSKLKETDDGWKITKIDYNSFRQDILIVFSEEVADELFGKYIRNEHGKLAYDPQVSASPFYRLCGLEDGVPVVYAIDPQGHSTRYHVEYSIGRSSVSAYVIDALSFIPD